MQGPAGGRDLHARRAELREAMRALCRRARLHYCDLLGQPLDAVAKVSGSAAKMTPGARPPLDSAYFKRIAAIEFAVKYDDGLGRGLHDADIVLVGVSRTSKTPLSIYLGYLGYKAANVPVVKGIEPPAELFEIDRAQDRRAHDRRRAGSPRSAASGCELMGGDRRVRRARRDLRGARARRGAPPPARLPGDRRLRALDRGDRAAHRPRRRAAARAAKACGRVKPKPPVPLWRWALW